MSQQTAQTPSVQSAIAATEAFFEPALRDRNDNSFIVQKLLAPRPPDDASRVELLKRAGNLLQSLHSAVRYEQNSKAQGQAYDSSLLLALYKLLDFLLLEGFYPSLPIGVGLVNESRAKSLFYRKHDSSYVPLKGSDQTALVLSNVLGPVLEDVDEALEPLVRHRALSDIIAGNAWLAHTRGLQTFLPQFSLYLQRLPTASLFAAYTALLKTSKLDWFRSMISEQLAVLPLRTNGVRSTIDFIAASHRPPPSESNGNPNQPSIGPALPIEALQQASKLLSSVPRAMPADSYFTKLAPQLTALLDSREEIALRKTAAFIIGNGILGKKSIGGPGTIGWKLFVEPIFQAINPKEPVETNRSKTNFPLRDTIEPILVPQSELELALRRLSTLIMSHPTPGLTGRLVRPLLLPLCAISNYRGLSFAATEASNAAFALVRQFLNLVGTPQNLQFLSENLLWNGTNDWSFGPGESGGIAVRKRDQASHKLTQEDDLERELKRIDTAILNFCNILNTSKISDDDMSILFHYVFSQQLGLEAKKTPSLLAGEQDLFADLARAKLLEALVEKFSDRLMRRPDQVLGLVDQVLFQSIQKIQSSEHKISPPSFAALANIATHGTQNHGPSENEDYQDTLMIVSSLLNAFSASSEAITNTETTGKVQTILKHLGEVENLSVNNETLSLQIKTTIALLRTKVSTGPALESQIDTGSIIDVQNTLNLITSDIASDLPPIRRSALHALQALIKSPDAPFDLPPIALLLLFIIRTDKEEFVYLAAIQTTVQLALRRNLGFVARLLIDSFQDAEEQTGVDGRLRIGESLASLVDEMAEVDVEIMKRADVLREMAQSLFVVAGRRGQRKRELLERQREERLRRRKHKEAERAWGGEVPDVPMEDDEEYENLTVGEKERRTRELDAIDSIVTGWEDTGYEEDVRIRASALSILSRMFENCAQDLASAITTTNSIDLCLSVLHLELDPAKAILRRAAALVLFGILKGVDAHLESGNGVSSTALMNGEEWLKIEKVLRWVMDTDSDELTVGHSEAVLEGLEAVRMKIIASAVDSASQVQDLDGNLRGLNVNAEAIDSGVVNRPRIEEIE